VELAYFCKGYWVYSDVFGLLAVMAVVAITSDRMKQHKSLVGSADQWGIVPLSRVGGSGPYHLTDWSQGI